MAVLWGMQRAMVLYGGATGFSAGRKVMSAGSKKALGLGVQRAHDHRGCRGVPALGRGVTEGPRLHTYPEGSSGSGSTALRQGSLKSWLKELGSILATSGRRAAVRGTGMIKDTPGRQHTGTSTQPSYLWPSRRSGAAPGSRGAA